MKTIFTTLLSLLVAAHGVVAQVGFNNTSPDPSSVLDLTATDKGLLVPRVTTAQRLAITTPATSLLVFDTTLGKFYYYKSGQWNPLDLWDQGATNTISYTGKVGINNAAPDASAILDVKATDKGMLVPRLTSAQRLAITTPATSLLVFDTTLNQFYFYSNGQWNTFDSWTKITGGITYTGQVGVNTPTPGASAILDVTATDKGLLIPRMTTAQRQAIVSPAQSLLVFDTNDSRFYFSNAGQWYAVNAVDRLAGSTTITHTGNLTVTGTVSATSYTGISGTVPTGGIIMWSGSVATIPAGWALCNGTNGTPDLRDRFIIGAGGTYTPGASGGSSAVSFSLTAAQLPSHSHPYRDRYYSESSVQSNMTTATSKETQPTNYNTKTGSGGSDGDNNTWLYYDSTTGTFGTGASIPLTLPLPPFYALAYIMKL